MAQSNGAERLQRQVTALRRMVWLLLAMAVLVPAAAIASGGGGADRLVLAMFGTMCVLVATVTQQCAAAFAEVARQQLRREDALPRAEPAP